MSVRYQEPGVKRQAVTVGSVLMRGKWQGVGEGYDRAQRADEAARRLEMELKEKREVARRQKVAEVREEIFGMGYAEYVPSEDATIERAESTLRHAKRKRWLAVHDPHTRRWMEMNVAEEKRPHVIEVLRRKRMAEHLHRSEA